MAYQNSDGKGTVNNVITDCLDYLITAGGEMIGFESECPPRFHMGSSKANHHDMPVISHEELVEDMKALGIQLTYQPFGLYIHTRDSNPQEVRFSLSVQDISEDGFDKAFTVAFIRSSGT
jgi:hypothetical protein